MRKTTAKKLKRMTSTRRKYQLLKRAYLELPHNKRGEFLNNKKEK